MHTVVRDLLRLRFALLAQMIMTTSLPPMLDNHYCFHDASRAWYVGLGSVLGILLNGSSLLYVSSGLIQC